MSKKKYKYFTKQQINELAAIYEDFLFIVRQHENVFNHASTKVLGEEQKDIMRDEKDIEPEHLWQITPLSPQEKQEYEDFINDDIWHDDTRTYMLLRHIKPELDNGYSKVFAIPPYKSMSINMQLPSALERCSIIYPENATLGETEFYIDGMYKATYIGIRKYEMPIAQYVRDETMVNELYVLVGLMEALRQNNNVVDANYEKLKREVFASGRVFINETIILELLGLFAERLMSACRKVYIGEKDVYSLQDNTDAMTKAKKDGLISSADDFVDYVNIRHFLRHQWDTLDELGSFSTKEAQANKVKRERFVASYLKLCDKRVDQRAKAYINILHQMQRIMNILCPERIIRYEDESKGKFLERAKEAFVSNPYINIELNCPLNSRTYQVLKSRTQKFLPAVPVVDFYPQDSDRFTKINDYVLRMNFLQTFTTMDCMIMRHAQIRGRDIKNKEAWDYMQEIGFLSPEEREKWHEYARLRNALSHYYYSNHLRKRLNDCEEQYIQDEKILQDRFTAWGPDVKKLRKDVYEYRHVDGLVVHQDRKHHKILYWGKTKRPEEPKQEPVMKMDVMPVEQKTIVPREVYPSGLELEITDNKIASVKLPNGICIHFDDFRINWDGSTYWTTNEKKFHVLQMGKSKLVMKKYLCVTEYVKDKNHIAISSGDRWYVDNKHILSFDSECKLKDFIFKNAKGEVIQTKLVHTPEEHNVLIFSDGTMVWLNGAQSQIRHGGKTLAFDNRSEFAATYITPQNLVQKIINNQHIY